MAGVPWELNRDRIEDAVAVMLLREYGSLNAQHRRGAGGDGGIDVYVPVTTDVAGNPTVDVDQIKNFTASLTATQWKQVRESLTRARDNSRVRIRTWYLTMPLNPTADDEKKLAKLAKDLNVPFPCVWRGLSYLNGLAAKYPAVIDRFFHDGNGRMAEERKALYGLLDLGKRATERLMPQDLLTPESSLATVARGLNAADPFYSYEIRMGEHLPLEVTSGLVMRQAIGGDGWYIALDVRARFPEAPLWSPLPEPTASFTLHPTNEPNAAVKEIDQALGRGESVTLLPSEVGDVDLAVPGGLSTTTGSATVRVTPWKLPPAPPRTRWRISDQDGAVIAEAEIVFRQAMPAGAAPFRLDGSESNGAFVIEAEVVPHDGHLDTQLKRIGVPNFVGRRASEMAAPLAFLAAFRAPNTLLIGFESGSVLHEHPIKEDAPPVDPHVAAYIGDLAAIQDHVVDPLLVPANATADQVATAAHTRWVLDGNGLKMEVAPGFVLRGQLPVQAARTLADASEPLPVSLAGPFLSLQVGDQVIALPQALAKVTAARFLGAPELDGSADATNVEVEVLDGEVVITVPSATSR